MLLKPHWESLNHSPWQEATCTHLWVEMEISKKCSVSEGFKSWSLVPWRLLITLASRNSDSLTYIEKFLFHLASHDPLMSLDRWFRTLPLEGEGIQEGREGAETGRRHVGDKKGITVAVSQPHYAFPYTSFHTFSRPIPNPPGGATYEVSLLPHGAVFLGLLWTLSLLLGSPGNKLNRTKVFYFMDLVFWAAGKMGKVWLLQVHITLSIIRSFKVSFYWWYCWCYF